MTLLERMQVTYASLFAGVAVVTIAVPGLVRPAFVVMGVAVALFGCCLAANVRGVAGEVAEKARAKPGAPGVFGSVTVIRVLALTMVVAGIAFVLQALLVNDL